MKIETYINNEAKKYKSKAIKNKQQGVNLDKLEKMAQQHINNCIEFITSKNISSYSEECKYKDMSRKTIEKVDEELFGCFNNQGKCLGYNFYK